IGILRAVGWRARRVALLVLGEALAICLVALGLGLGLGLAAAELFTRWGTISQLVQPQFTAGVFAWGLAFACGVGLLGAAYPVWRAVRLTPIALGAAATSPDHRHLHVLDRREHGHEVVELEDEADGPGAVLGRIAQLVHPLAADPDRARVGLVERADEVQQGALAAARRPG